MMQPDERLELATAAYQRGWQQLITAPMSPDERDHAPRLLHNHVWRLVNSGAKDARAIAEAALGRMRQDEQIGQSAARLKSRLWA
jgi:hypothetical protein